MNAKPYLEIFRFLDHPARGCFGDLRVAGLEHMPAMFTVEQPWNDNKPFESCIPLGEYELRPYSGTKYKNVFVLVNENLNVYEKEEDVPEHLRGIARYACLIHIANWARDVQGCIGPGMALRVDSYESMVIRSRQALNELRRTIKAHNINRVVIKGVAG